MSPGEVAVAALLLAPAALIAVIAAALGVRALLVVFWLVRKAFTGFRP